MIANDPTGRGLVQLARYLLYVTIGFPMFTIGSNKNLRWYWSIIQRIGVEIFWLIARIGNARTL